MPESKREIHVWVSISIRIGIGIEASMGKTLEALLLLLLSHKYLNVALKLLIYTI